VTKEMTEQGQEVGMVFAMPLLGGSLCSLTIQLLRSDSKHCGAKEF
jgi:hypothetical protein